MSVTTAEWCAVPPTTKVASVSEPWPEDVRRDLLIGDWYIYQRTGGHRTSTDDVVTAWHASRGWTEPPARYLDLGCGIGSVLLTVVHRLRPVVSLGVEAQSQSVLMARRTIAELPDDAPEVSVRESDFRTFEFGDARFDLITGSPPYFPLGTGVLPNDPQRVACRFETRGGVEAYCEVASKVLADEGRIHLVFQTEWNERVEHAARDAALHIVDVCHFRMRSDSEAPFLTTYELRRRASPRTTRTLAVRDSEGRYTPEFRTLRHELGAKPDTPAA